jgi:PhnB protein
MKHLKKCRNFNSVTIGIIRAKSSIEIRLILNYKIITTMKIQAYLAFRGNCQDALNFYSQLFDANIENRKTYENTEIDLPTDYRNKLQHAELKGKNIHFMAYDAAPDTPLTHGNQVCMSIEANSEAEGKEMFDKLSSKGTIHHNYKVREWGHYGRCTDKFGISWMVNYSA